MYIFSEPARWLTGKAGELGWGLDDSSELLDAIYDMMRPAALDLEHAGVAGGQVRRRR